MKRSGDPWTASGMKSYNKPHEAPVRAFLSAIVHDPKNHAKFLNMLLMLEHMGSRKIIISQSRKPEVMNQDTLQHLAEEAHHLAEMFEMCGEKYDLLQELSRYETSLFAKLWDALEAAYLYARDNAKAA